MRRRFWSHFANLVWTCCDPCSYSAIFTWIHDPDCQSCCNQVKTTLLDVICRNPGFLMFFQLWHVWPTVWPTIFFDDAPTKWLILDCLRGYPGENHVQPVSRWSRSLRTWGIHPSSMGFFPSWLLEEEVEKTKVLLVRKLTGSFHGICHVFASPMPSCESMMRHVEEVSWNHFRWIHVNLWNKNAD